MVCYDQGLSVCAPSISLGLMIKQEAQAGGSSKRLKQEAFGLKQEALLRWTYDRSRVDWEEFVHCPVKANETYSEAKRQLSARNSDVLKNARSLNKWWSTLKSYVQRVRHCHLLLVGGGGLV